MILLEERAILAFSGEDRFTFLQGLMTNDILPLQSGEVPTLYSALLSPQGKVRFDFFLYLRNDVLYMDVPATQLEDIRKILKLYKLRADVEIAEQPELGVVADLHENEQMPLDPRLASMGHRDIVARESLVGTPLLPELSYHAHRIALGIPDSADFIPDRAFVAEYGLDKINGVSFTKGCFIGQEVVARTHHRGTVHKTLHRASTEEGTQLPETGTPITAGDIELGQLRRSVENQGLAVIRRDKLAKAKGAIMAGEVKLTALEIPEWFD